MHHDAATPRARPRCGWYALVASVVHLVAVAPVPPPIHSTYHSTKCPTRQPVSRSHTVSWWRTGRRWGSLQRTGRRRAAGCARRSVAAFLQKSREVCQDLLDSFISIFPGHPWCSLLSSLHTPLLYSTAHSETRYLASQETPSPLFAWCE